MAAATKCISRRHASQSASCCITTVTAGGKPVFGGELVSRVGVVPFPALRPPTPSTHLPVERGATMLISAAPR